MQEFTTNTSASLSDNVKVSLSQVVNQNYITMQKADEYKYTDLWTKEEKITKDEIACEVAPHGVAVFRVKPF